MNHYPPNDCGVKKHFFVLTANEEGKLSIGEIITCVETLVRYADQPIDFARFEKAHFNPKKG